MIKKMTFKLLKNVLECYDYQQGVQNFNNVISVVLEYLKKYIGTSSDEDF